jgi:hypothetical protein
MDSVGGNSYKAMKFIWFELILYSFTNTVFFVLLSRFCLSRYKVCMH